jgi:hypothetical protein
MVGVPGQKAGIPALKAILCASSWNGDDIFKVVSLIW